MPDLSTLRKSMGSFTLGLAILVLVVLVCFLAFVFYQTRFVEDTVKLVVDNISQRSGLSVFLVEGVVIIVTIPFFWAVGKFTKNIWGLFNLGWDSTAPYKNKYGIIIVLYIAVYFLAMYGASFNAYEYKFCADTPEGIWTSDSPGKDPVYGIEAQKCSRTQRLALREGTGHLRPPREVSIADAENYEWFDPVTGQPRVWYSAVSDHGFRFFDGRGVDPHSSQELKPVSAEIVDRVRRLQASQVASRKEAQREVAEAQRKKDAIAQQAQRESQIGILAQQAQSSFDFRNYQSAFDTCSQVLKVSA